MNRQRIRQLAAAMADCLTAENGGAAVRCDVVFSAETAAASIRLTWPAIIEGQLLAAEDGGHGVDELSILELIDAFMASHGRQ